MKYMLMMNGSQKGWAQFNEWPQEDLKRHIDFMIGFVGKLAAAGELAAAEGLAFPSEAKLVRAAKDGTPMTDGVFPESKEFLAGYWIVQVDSADRAYQIAAEASMAPGRGGEPMRMPIEVRQVMSEAPADLV